MFRRTVLFAFVLLLGCGARTSLEQDDSADRFDAAVRDAGVRDASPIRDSSLLPDGFVPRDSGCMPVEDGCGATEVCGNGSNDDCDDQVDEGCGCEPGAVQSCFAGPPGRRDVGACQDGSQVCDGNGRWGGCTGGILPDSEVCTGRDDLCNGCSDERICPIDCPSPGDPRVPVGQPFAAYPLRGRDFYVGPARGWRWIVQGGPCDGLAPRLTSYDLEGPASENAVLTPRLSGDYRITLQVTTPGGAVLECSWIVHVEGPGLRIEMCYPESESQDLDLYLHRPNDTTPWFASGGSAFDPVPEASCGWHNCEADIRLGAHPITGQPVTRADWGYADSPLEACINGPQGARWAIRGSCANPRLDIDNNLSKASGVPENINVDAPRDGETFRIMVQNFTGERARPVVNVYCGGTRVATFGQEPDIVRNFRGPPGGESPGAMWRVADVTTRVDPATGETIGCMVQPLHRPGMTTGYYVTVDDPSY